MRLIVFEYGCVNRRRIRMIKESNNKDLYIVFSKKDYNKLVYYKQNVNLVTEDSIFSVGQNEDIIKEVTEQTNNIFQEIKEEVNKEYYNYISSFRNVIYWIVKRSGVIKKIISSFIEKNGIDSILLFGKRTKYHYNDYIIKMGFLFTKYGEDIYEVLKELALKNNITFKILECRRMITKIISYSLLYIVEILKRYCRPIYIYRNNHNNDHENILFLIRGNTHFNYFNTIFENKRELYNYMLIVDGFYKIDIPNNEYTKIGKINNITNGNKIDPNIINTVKRVLIQNETDYSVFCFLLKLYYGFYNIIKKQIDLFQIKLYINFEETTYFSALFTNILKEDNIKSVTIQHGYTAVIDATLPLLSDYRFVWGNKTKSMYIDFGENKRNIICIGEELFSINNNTNTERKDIYIICGFQKDYIYLAEWIIDILKSVLANQKNSKIVISFHPYQKNIQTIRKIIDINYYNTISRYVYRISDDDYKNALIMIMDNSTVGFSAAIKGVNVIIIKNKENNLYDYINHNYFYKIININELPEIIEKIKNDTTNDIENKRKDFLYQYIFSEKSIKYIIEKILHE